VDHVEVAAAGSLRAQHRTVYSVIAAVALCHFLNDLMSSSLLPSVFPMFKDLLHLSFAQIGLLALTYQLTASLLQPVVGLYTDHHPMPFSLPLGLAATFVGLLLLSVASSFSTVVLSAALAGVGSSVFHPESSRVARMASGGQYGLAQSLFQVGGNAGQAAAPLLIAFVVLSRGQASIAWFSLVALLTIALLIPVSRWYRAGVQAKAAGAVRARATTSPVPARQVKTSMAILVALLFSKNFYMASISNFLIFYVMAKFDVSQQVAQVNLFVFLAAVALGTLVGGPVGDRIGRKYVIWVSILGVLPFTLLLPYASLFFGLAFGLGGVGAALLGWLADKTGIDFVYHVCAFLPAIGLLTAFLPHLHQKRLQAA
jgi:MFS transporter, FSR family, fosmidomycin resistance protein